MIKRIEKSVKRRYRIVKKFSTVMEARLAQEILGVYHIRTMVVRSYLTTKEQLEQGVREISLLVLPQDYQAAYQVLYSE